MTAIRRAGAPLLLLLLPLAAAAERQLPLWEAGLGVAALSLPHYRGAEKSRHWLLPTPYAVYRGEVLRANRDGVKAMLLDSERIDFDLSVAATAPSRSADEPARQGMADLPATLEFGPNVNLRLLHGLGWKLDLRLPVRAAFTLERGARSLGWSSSPNLSYDRELAGWNLGLQAALPWGSRRLHQHFYGVSAADSRPDRPVFRADGGRAGWQATVALSRRDGDRWFGAFVRADSLSGTRIAESPLVRRTHNLTFGVAMSWVIWQSDRLVRDPDALR